MSIVNYYHPRNLEKEVDRLFNSFGLSTVPAAMPLDVIEHEDAYEIVANVPGFTKDQIEITADHESMSIKAAVEQVEEDTEATDAPAGKVLRRERMSRSLERTLHFRKPVSAKNATLKLENGVLTINIPFAEEAKPVKLSL